MTGNRQLFEVKERNLVPKVEEIKIFHDERYDDKNTPFGHQFLIVPLRSEELVNKFLNQKRRKFNASNRTINWKKLSKRDWEVKRTARAWNNLLSYMMAMKPFKGVGEKGKIIHKKQPLGVKLFSLFIPSRSRMSDKFWMHIKDEGERKNRKYETLMKMAVKGGLKWLFNPGYTPYQRTKVQGFYTDGEVFGGRNINTHRVLGRVQRETPDYIEIPNDLKPLPVEKSKDKTLEVNFEELTDLALGSTCYICGDTKEEWRSNITKPLKELYDKRARGSGFHHSSHFRTFSVSICDVVDGDLVFNDLWSSEEKGKKQLFMEFAG